MLHAQHASSGNAATAAASGQQQPAPENFDMVTSTELLQEQDAQHSAIAVTQQLWAMLQQQPVAGQVGAIHEALTAANAERDPMQRAIHKEMLTLAVTNILNKLAAVEGAALAAAADSYIEAGYQTSQ